MLVNLNNVIVASAILFFFSKFDPMVYFEQKNTLVFKGMALTPIHIFVFGEVPL